MTTASDHIEGLKKRLAELDEQAKPLESTLFLIDEERRTIHKMLLACGAEHGSLQATAESLAEAARLMREKAPDVPVAPVYIPFPYHPPHFPPPWGTLVVTG